MNTNELVVQVGSEGSKSAKIAFVGQAPSTEEVLQGRPFVGPAGRELMRQLMRVGIRRQDIYITNVIKRKLQGNDIKPFYSNSSGTKPTEELQAWWDLLNDELESLHPNVIVALGNDALLALTGESGIGKWRGSIVKSAGGLKVVPTYHPSGVLQNWKVRPLVLADFRKAKRESLFPWVNEEKWDFLIPKSIEEIKEYFDQIRKAGICAVDIETQWGSRIVCVGFSYKKNSAMCIPFFHPEAYWGYNDKLLIENLIQGILGDPSIKKVGQNFHYDWSWFRRDGYVVKNFWFDTMVAQHVAWPELPKDLATLASLYTNHSYWKDEAKDYNKIDDWDKLFRYNCKDAAVTLELVIPLQIELRDLKDQFDFEMSLIPVFVDNTLQGIRFDNEKRKEFLSIAKRELRKASKELDGLIPKNFGCLKCKGTGKIRKRSAEKKSFIKTFKTKPDQTVWKFVMEEKTCPECKGTGNHLNAGSPVQVKNLIQNYLRIPRLPKLKTTDEDMLLKLQARHPNPIFEKLLRIRGLNNLIGFLQVKIDSDGRIRTTLVCNTETGRLSSSKSPWRTGRNLQNITSQNNSIHKSSKIVRIRELFVADEGMKLAGPDYSKAEAYVMAFESGDEKYINALVNGDIHRKNASVIFGVEEKAVTSDMRQLGKRACHGINYMMGPLTLCDYIIKEMGPNFAITMAESKRFREAYLETYSGIRQFQERIQNQIETVRVLVNGFGRKRTFLGRPTGETIRKAVAFIPQSTVGDLTNRAVLRVVRISGVKFLLQVHDQILLEYRKEEEDRVLPLVEKAMAVGLEAHYTGLKYSIPIEMKVGYDWENLHKVEGKQ